MDLEVEDAGVSSSEEGGLDLLASLLESEGEDEAVLKPNPTSCCKRKGEEVGGEGGKRRRVESSSGGSDGLAVEDRMAQMSAKMLKMEEELSRLRQEVVLQEQQRSVPPSRRADAPSRPATGNGRTAHHSNIGVASTISRLSESAHQMRGGKRKGGLGTHPRPQDREMAAGIIAQRKLDEERNCMTEKNSGIRIKNPLVSRELMRQRMEGRTMVRIPRISSRMKDGEIEGDWVTMGVVVDKLPPRDTVKGKKFVVWRLSDLSSQTAVVSLFLFGQAYQEHWKIPQGHVIALLNPSIMPGRESDHGGIALSLDRPQKLMPMGVSQDFTVCKAHTKSGKKCVNFAKLSDGGYCDYHTQGAYKMTRSQRMEFQSGYGPSSGGIRERILKGSNAEVVYYRGQSVTVPSSKSGASKTPSSPEMDRRLFAPGAKTSAAKVSMELKEQREMNGTSSVQAGHGVVTHEGSELFKEMLKTQRLGAQMLSLHYQKEESTKKGGAKHTSERSAAELLQAHKAELRQKSVQKRASSKPVRKLSAAKDSENDAAIDDLFTPDCVFPPRGNRKPDSRGEHRDNSAHSRRDGGYHGDSTGTKSPDSSAQDSDGIEPHSGVDLNPADSEHASSTPSVMVSSPAIKRGKVLEACKQNSSRGLPSLRMLERQGAGGNLDHPSAPMLCRGMAPGTVVELKSPTSSKPSRAKLKALAVVQRRNEIDSQSPDVSKRRKQEAIWRRVEENLAGSDCNEGEGNDGEEGALKQRQLDAAEVERIINAKSSHEWAVKEDEWEREQQYFDHLEKKENLEEKLRNIREMRITVVQCRKCGYVSEHPGELCKKENHHLSRFKVMKRCFQCKGCRERCHTYNAKYPTDLCRKCGGKSFEQTSIYKERQGPKLPSEQLLLRGTEEKYLNSLK